MSAVPLRAAVADLGQGDGDVWRAVAYGKGRAWRGPCRDVVGAVRQAVRWSEADEGAWRLVAVESEHGVVLEIVDVAIVELGADGTPTGVERVSCVHVPSPIGPRPRCIWRGGRARS